MRAYRLRFLWAVGTSPNATDVMDWQEYGAQVKWACADVQLNHSDTYYNTIAAYNKALNSRRSEATSDGSMANQTKNYNWKFDANCILQLLWI